MKPRHGARHGHSFVRAFFLERSRRDANASAVPESRSRALVIVVDTTSMRSIVELLRSLVSVPSVAVPEGFSARHHVGSVYANSQRRHTRSSHDQVDDLIDMREGVVCSKGRNRCVERCL